jgi:glycosyltransferase involved in cell wall biosynthesis
MNRTNNLSSNQNYMPRIAHLTSAHRSTDIRIFHKECCSLSDAGFIVNLVAPGKQDELRGRVKIHAFPAAKNRFSRFTSSIYRIFQIAKRIDADLYHLHDPDLIFIGLFLQKRGKQVIYDVHEDNPRNLLSRKYIPSKVRKPLSQFYKILEDYAAKNFRAIIAATPSIGERFRKINANNVIINNYPLLNELKPIISKRWDEREISVCYVGAITHIRGAIQMVLAMENVQKVIPAKLEMAGEIWPENLRKEAMGLTGWQNVRELGMLTREEVSHLYARTRAGLVLFHPLPNHIQSQPNKLFEYMSAGLPVIASDFPLWRDIVGNTGCGLLVNPMDVPAISNAIHTLLHDNKKAEEMGMVGRELIEKKFNWSTEEAKLINLYNDILSS